MSILSQPENSAGQLASIVDNLGSHFEESKADIFTPQTSKNVLGLESLTPSALQETRDTYFKVTDIIKSSGLPELLDLQVSKSNPDRERLIKTGLEAASIALMASGGDGSEYLETYGKMANATDYGAHAGTLIDVSVPGISPVAGMESYAKQDFSKFAAYSAVVAALSVTAEDNGEALFPTEVVPAGQSGVTVSVRIPYVANMTKRGANGAKFEMLKKPLTHAIEDHTILENDATVLFPNAADAGNDPKLVSLANMGGFNLTRTVNGIDVQTRPILFGEEVDLISLCANTALIGSDQLDNSDVLDRALFAGHIYVQVTHANGGSPVTQVVPIDTTTMAGSLFHRPTDGKSNELTVNFNAVVGIGSNSDVEHTEDGFAKAMGDLIEPDLGLAVGDKFQLQFKVGLSGNASESEGNIALFKNVFALDGIATGQGGTKLERMDPTSAEYTTAVGNLTFELLGYIPKARLVNINQRMRGFYIDSGEEVRFTYPVYAGSPISSIRPISGDTGIVAVQGLQAGLRIQTSNKAITTLLESESRIKAMVDNHSTNISTGMIGALLVDPYYDYQQRNVQTAIKVNRSGEGYDDLRAFLVDEISTMVDRMALDSRFLSALQNWTGAEREYDVVLLTDPRVAGYLMISGDSRTLGVRHSFQIHTSLDSRVRNRVYITFRRKVQKGIDPMSYGARLFMTPLVHEVPNINDGRAIHNLTQVQPREIHTVSLPILARLDIEGLDEYHVRTDRKSVV